MFTVKVAIRRSKDSFLVDYSQVKTAKYIYFSISDYGDTAANDSLAEVPEGVRQSPLDRLRDGPYMQSGREISRALARLAEVSAITSELPATDRLPPGKVSALARFAVAAKAQAVARLPPDRRAATVPAFIHTLEASAGDDVIDLFDAVTTSMFTQAATASKEARPRSLRDLDAAALKLRDAAIIVLDPETPAEKVRAAIFHLISSDALAAAAERVGTLAEPHDDTYFAELRKHPRKIAYTPELLAGLDLGAAPAGRSLLEAVEYLRVVHSGRKRSGPAPIAFAPKAWQDRLKTADGSLDMTGYRLCVLDGLRRAIRRRGVFPVRRYVMATRERVCYRERRGRLPDRRSAAPSEYRPQPTRSLADCRAGSISRIGKPPGACR
jgi:hypothetical protein